MNIQNSKRLNRIIRDIPYEYIKGGYSKKQLKVFAINKLGLREEDIEGKKKEDICSMISEILSNMKSRTDLKGKTLLDIYQKDGNSKNFHMNGGIGLISSRLLAEGPLEKEKGSFLIGGRASYAHLFLKLSKKY